MTTLWGDVLDPNARQIKRRDATSYWDPNLVNQRRIFNTGQRAWLGGADAFLQPGARWDRETNPYDAAAERARLGDQYVEKVEDYMYDGARQLTEYGYGLIRDAGGRGTPFLDVFPQDVSPYLEALGSDWYNPFDSWNQNEQTQRREGGAMDYLYQQTKDLSNVGKREDVLRAWESATAGMSQDAKRNLRMSEGLYNRMGLADTLGEYQGPKMSLPSRDRSESGGFLSTYKETRGQPTPKSGGFMESYLARKNAPKTSVMSLFKEMKDYE